MSGNPWNCPVCKLTFESDQVYVKAEAQHVCPVCRIKNENEAAVRVLADTNNQLQLTRLALAAICFKHNGHMIVSGKNIQLMGERFGGPEKVNIKITPVEAPGGGVTDLQFQLPPKVLNRVMVYGSAPERM